MSAAVGTALLLPLAASLVSIIPARPLRRWGCRITGGLLLALALPLWLGGTFSHPVPVPWLHSLVHAADYLLLAVVAAVTLRLRSLPGFVFTAAQLALLLWLDLGPAGGTVASPALAADGLSLVMALVVNGVGGLVLLYTPAYMDRYLEEHPGAAEGRFYVFLVLFLGAMNGLVFSNDLRWFLLFWEITTVCSFVLIATDRTPEAVRSGLQALWMTMLGGLCLVAGMIVLFTRTGSLSMAGLVQEPASGPVLIGFALLAVAGLTKAAQVPFHGWLIRAMVAPAPVSALLHASTMVKAGAYLILRISPAVQGTLVAPVVTWIGLLSFLGLGAAAVAREEGKHILACSTIMNLGLITVCAGLGDPAAMAGAVILLLFHAVSKALLFLGAGAARRTTGAGDLAGLRGLSARMPLTAFLLGLALLTLLVPPFGLVAGKWLALESAADRPLVLAFLALGMGFHVLIYARWAGDLVCAVPGGGERRRLSNGMGLPMLALAALAAGLPFVLPSLYEELVVPGAAIRGAVKSLPGGEAFSWIPATGAALGLVVLLVLLAVIRSTGRGWAPPYCCGAEGWSDGVPAFKGPLSRFEPHRVEDALFASGIGSWPVNRVLVIAGSGLLTALLLGTLLGVM